MSAEKDLLAMAQEALGTVSPMAEEWLVAEPKVVEEVDDYSCRRNMVLKAVIIYDDNGNYLIHGSNSESTVDMLKAMAPLWPIDPSFEDAQVIEIPVSLPKIADQMKVRVFNNNEK